MTAVARLTLTLAERTQRIMDVLSASALAIGEELLMAKREHPGEFMAWVSDCLPFGIDKAERLMAITRALSVADPETRLQLPPAWSALYELSRIPAPQLAVLVERDEVTPATTVREAREFAQAYCPAPQPVDLPTPAPYVPLPEVADHSTDLIALNLLRADRDKLSEDIAERVGRWLHGS